MKISGVIITFNEEEKIGECIESLKEVVDEIIVIDSFSTDATETICRNKNVKFIQNTFQGHIQQKNFALHQTSNNWVLSLDADERLSLELKKEILNCIDRNSEFVEAYLIKRFNNYCGKWIRHGVWYPDKKIRLWNKTRGKWDGRNPHDKVVMDKNSKIQPLNGTILHYTARTPEQYKLQMEKFSAIAAHSMLKERIRSNLLKAYIGGAFAFFRSYCLRLGFLDGRAGYEIAIGYGHYTLMKYKKMLTKN